MDVGISHIESSTEQDGYSYISGVTLASDSPISKTKSEDVAKRGRKKRGDRGTHKNMNTESMDNYLISIAETRDRIAFKKLFAAFAPKVKSFAMRNGVGPELAEEVVQETFIRVWRKAEQFDPVRLQQAHGFTRSREISGSTFCGSATGLSLTMRIQLLYQSQSRSQPR